jgi:glycosyltransferase involved in cell wall biosynthesis
VELARRLDPARYDVTLGCLQAQGPLLERLRDSSVAIAEFYPKGGLDSVGGIYQLLRLRAFLRRGGFDIVHTHDLWSNLMGVPAAWMVRVPVIISSRRDLSNFDWYQTGRRVWLRRIQNLSQVVLTNADTIRDGLIAEDGFAPQKVRVIHNGVDTDRFSVAPRGRNQLFPGAGEGKLIVLVGNMHSDVKGHSWLITAAPVIVRDFPQTRFVFAGDGEQRKEFERQAEGLGLQRNFLFLGRRGDIPEILACCDVAVLPSKAEGLPNAVLEYLAAGLPTIASDVGGNAEIIKDGVTGLLVPPQDSEALAAAVLRLLRNPDLARRLAQGGHEYVRQNFSFERLIEQVDNLYSELLQRRKARNQLRNRAGKNRWRRLVSMSKEEFADRLRQHVTARSDLLRHKLGVGFQQALRVEDVQQKPRFFFLPEAVPSLCALLKQRLPENVEAILQQAERICGHRFDLLGYEGLDYGREIDWHCDRVHNQRAPRKPWFKIRYLDFTKVGDSKITWELNRHQHLVTLAKAYRLTGNEKFATELFRQWQHWHEENSYPIGVNWASSLEVGVRSLSWLWVYFLLAGSTAMRDYRTEWLRALSVNGRHIETYLSTYFSPNTHLLGEGVALFFIGTLCPELQSAERWKRRGWEIVLREAERQVQADGLHFEQSTYYHVYALDFFLHAGMLASINDVPVPPEFERTLERMLDALCTLGRVGAPLRLGDDDGGRVFDPRRNRAEHLLDPLATGAVLFGRGDFKRVASGLREETLWLLGEQGVAEFDRLPAKDPAQGSVALQAGGLYLMTNAELKQQLVIDAGPQGAFAAGHGHADALSVCVNSRGHALLIDPGTFEYVGADSVRDAFRGTSAHNTLVVDGVDQTEPKGPFGWTKLPSVKAEKWIQGHSFDLFVGSHDGYGRLERPVVHRRWVFSLKGKFWLVRDVALGAGEHQLDLFWHLSPELSARGGAAGVFVDAGGRAGLRVLAGEGHDWLQHVRPQSWSPVYGRKEPANVLHLGTLTELPAELVTLLEPVVDANIPHGSLARMRHSSAQGLVSGYRYRTPEEEHFIFFSEGNAWTLGQWSSDAEFLYWGRSANRARQAVICCNGTYVEAGGRRLVSCPRQVLRGEIISADEQVDVFSSDEDAMVSKEALPNVSAELEPVLTSGLPGSGKTGL